MIPTIEDILNDLIHDRVALSKAIALVQTHIDTAIDADGLRDHFAGLAMQGDIAGLSLHLHQYTADEMLIKAKAAYQMADAMMEARV